MVGIHETGVAQALSDSLKLPAFYILMGKGKKKKGGGGEKRIGGEEIG